MNYRIKARKKPVVIDAFLYLREENINEFVDWVEEVTGKHNAESIKHLPISNEWYCRTLEGDMMISKGDYVICGVNKELYPCKPDIFEKTYDIFVDFMSVVCDIDEL
jgi:hypothetical protein